MISFCAKELSIRTNKEVFFEVDDPVELYDDLKSLGNTVGKVKFELRNNFVIVTGKFETPLRLKCDRCDKDYDINLNFEVDEAIEVNDNPLPEELEFTADTIHEQISSTEQIDIGDYIRQYVILNLPSKRLCSESCVNSKLDDFSVKNDEVIDPRWENLASYKDKIKGE